MISNVAYLSSPDGMQNLELGTYYYTLHREKSFRIYGELPSFFIYHHKQLTDMYVIRILRSLKVFCF